MDVVMPKPGKYVVAVSGGVDSMALLDILVQEKDLDLLVVHFDHGIREDSDKDSKLVEEVANKYKLPFVSEKGELGKDASEAKARDARYKFLRQVMKDENAAAIITAHHRDDVLETAIINILRGTGRKGLTSLKNKPDILRPLLNISKKELINYAKKNNLGWHEDSTNQDTNYLRNYVRHELLPRFSDTDRANLVGIVTKSSVVNEELDEILSGLVSGQKINRNWYNQLPHDVAREVMAGWLRQEGVSFDRRTIEKLVVAAKTGKAGKLFPIQKGVSMVVHENDLALTGLER